LLDLDWTWAARFFLIKDSERPIGLFAPGVVLAAPLGDAHPFWPKARARRGRAPRHDDGVGDEDSEGGADEGGEGPVEGPSGWDACSMSGSEED